MEHCELHIEHGLARVQPLFPDYKIVQPNSTHEEACATLVCVLHESTLG